jgi:competence protein ComEA
MASELTSADEETGNKWEEILYRNKISVILFIVGLALIAVGILIYKSDYLSDSSNIEVLNAMDENNVQSEVVVEISGAVEKPGVYKMQDGSRIEDLLIVAGGLSANANRQWVERNINRAAKVADGQKVYIPDNQSTEESANNASLGDFSGNTPNDTQTSSTNINTASQNELETLPGIGPVYAQSIIEHRPYSTVEELVSKGALKQFIFDKIKDLVNVY